MKARYLAPVFLFLFICTAFSSYAQAPPENPTVQKMAELKWMLGKWKQEGTFLPNGSAISNLMNCDWLFENTVIECKIPREDSFDELERYHIISYDANLDNYVFALYFDVGMGPMIGSLVKNGESWTYQTNVSMPGIKMWNQEIYTLNGDTVDVLQYRSMNGSEVMKTQEATLTRMD